MTETKKWFENWFDSPYYHKLYKHRDYREAELFIHHLVEFLKPSLKTHFLEMACGNGRHAHFIAKKGYRVTGFDLSKNNILLARKNAPDLADFFIHDMLEPFPGNSYDYILNLFTSFGYFDDEKTHLQVLDNVKNALKADGNFILDFFNVKKVREELIPEETKQIEGIVYDIRKKIEDNKVIKEIAFVDKGQQYLFKESVYGFDLNDFEKMFEKTSLKITDVFGDYSLNRFDENSSPRLILFVKKSDHGVAD